MSVERPSLAQPRVWPLPLVADTRSLDRIVAISLKVTIEVTKTTAHPVFFINRHPLVWFNSGPKCHTDLVLSSISVPKAY